MKIKTFSILALLFIAFSCSKSIEYTEAFKKETADAGNKNGKKTFLVYKNGSKNNGKCYIFDYSDRYIIEINMVPSPTRKIKLIIIFKNKIF